MFCEDLLYVFCWWTLMSPVQRKQSTSLHSSPPPQNSGKWCRKSFPIHFSGGVFYAIGQLCILWAPGLASLINLLWWAISSDIWSEACLLSSELLSPSSKEERSLDTGRLSLVSAHRCLVFGRVDSTRKRPARTQIYYPTWAAALLWGQVCPGVSSWCERSAWTHLTADAKMRHVCSMLSVGH